jgi:hypothetical protein
MTGVIAFHELVTIKSWADSSSRGPSIKVALPSRDSLLAFEKITKRAGKRAGQRFASIWQRNEGPDSSEPRNIELWFAGANWAHQDGASVKFSLDEDGFDWFKSGLMPMMDGDEPAEYWLTLVQIDEDEKPINQKKAEVLEELKGGPKSKRVAMLCQQADFQDYVAYRINSAQVGGERIPDVDPKAADAWVKGICGIKSKVELDHNEDAWAMFQSRIMSPFIRWGETQKWRDDDEADGS